MTKRILLAWEHGAGRGHITMLKSIATILGEAFSYDASLCRMEYAHEIAPLCKLAFQGSALLYDESHRHGPNGVRSATWGEFLSDSGFRNKVFLTGEIGWWQENLRGRKIDLVVADYAPCAMMAAKSMGIPAVVAGTGYSIPPIGLKAFPDFLPEFTVHLYDEAETLATINEAVVPLGVPELRHFSDVYRRDAELVHTLDILDPYEGQRNQPVISPVTDLPREIAHDGDEIFAYFSMLGENDGPIISALAKMDVPRRIFGPGLSAQHIDELAAGGAIIETAPVSVDLIAERSRMMVHLGQHGILALGIAAGLPHIALPQHLEHSYHARRAQDQGVCKVIPNNMRGVDALHAFIQAAYDDETMAQTARDLAHRLRPIFEQDTAQIIRDRVLPLLT